MAKKHSVNWEDEVPVSFEVDGVKYDSLEDVPNLKDRRKLEAMLDTSEEIDQSFDDPSGADERRQFLLARIERSPHGWL